MLRGPIWEILTGFSLAMAGADIFMMMNPIAVACPAGDHPVLMGPCQGGDS